jgi:hypothetical protein
MTAVTNPLTGKTTYTNNFKSKIYGAHPYEVRKDTDYAITKKEPRLSNFGKLPKMKFS